MSTSKLGDISPEEFRQQGYRVVDWITEYLAHPERYPVLAQVQPGDVRRQLPTAPPEAPESIDAALRDLDRIILPGVTHWNHPAFMAYFGISGSGPGILGEMLAAAFNVNAMLWKTCPAATELEECVLDWLRQLLGLEAEWFGQIVDTASVASLCAMAAAREAVPGLEVRQHGLAGRADQPRLCLYTSVESHSSIEKGAIVLGIGCDGVRKIAVDDAFRLDPVALEQAIVADRAAGWHPFCVVATVGTTSTTSVDPVAEIADLCAAHGLWLHVDAAYGGAAAIMPEMRDVLAGCDRADSLVVNPHKWLFTPIDCSAFYCRQPEMLRRAFSLVPEYLRTGEDEGVRNLMDYGISLGRRFRALKLWLVLRRFGRQGIVDRLREHLRLAREFAGWVEAAPDFELMAPVPFSVVCFRALGSDEFNQQLMDAVNATGEVYLSHTRLHDQLTLRVAIGNIRTTEKEVRRAWELLSTHARELRA